MTADGGGVVWSAAQKGVKGMDLGDLERAVGGGSQPEPEPEPEPGAGGGRRKAPQAAAEEKAREKAAMIQAMQRRVEGGGAKQSAAAPLTPAQQAVAQIKAADALLAEGDCGESLETALGMYCAALEHFGRRPKLEQKIAEVEGRLGAEGGRR